MNKPTQPVVHILDDDEEIRDMLMALVQAAGHVVVSYSRPSQFLEKLDQSTPGTLILDVRLPEMSGLEVVQHIRADKDTKKAKVPVVVLTADIDRHDEEAFRKAGFNDWLLKPFKERDIYKSILKQLPRARMQAN